MREMWNARHPDDQIESQDPKVIWNILRQKYRQVCNKESCWIRQMAAGTKLEQELMQSFAPLAPKEWKKKPNDWLSSVEIEDVMKQYEKAYKCFEFIGPTPIDFDKKMLNGTCVWNELCDFKLAEKIKEGKYKIGIIFNTDTHDKPGQHWISCFINIRKGTIYFFDSAGDPIPKEIKVLVDRIIEQGKKLPKPIHFKFDQNYPVEHQYKNTECGIYSLFFIAHMLEDKITLHYLKTHKLKDEYMQKFRQVYFNRDL